MIWKLTDVNKNKFSNIESGNIVNIGNINDCDILISTPKDKSILFQIIFQNNFIFSVHENKVFVNFEKHDFSLYGQKFIFEKCSENNEIFELVPSYSEVQEIYSSQEFLKYLFLVQEKLSQNKNFVTNNYQLLSDDVIKIAINILDSIFWNDRNVFEENQRILYQKYLWMIWSQICEYGILTLCLNDSEISEIMVNDTNHIYLETRGMINLSPLKFNSETDLYSIIERICSAAGRRIDESMPYCDARLKDGSRVHAIIPPLALNGPCLTIRKFPKHAITPYKLVELGSISDKMFDFLQDIVSNKKNVLISGGTGSGKTTLLNCLSYFIPNHERIITIEDSAELKLQQQHVIRLESRSENIEKKGAVTMRDLVKNSLRMRPDRIIVGECRGGEALDMLQAMNTGHDGSMTTVHANNPADALRRLETLVLFAEFDLPSRAIREQITSAVQYVVQQSRLPNGFRGVTAIHEIVGLCEKTGNFITKAIFSRCLKTGIIKC